jgi:hypothetical protein
MSKSIPDAFLSAIAGGEPVSFQDIMSLGLDLNAAGGQHQSNVADLGSIRGTVGPHRRACRRRGDPGHAEPGGYDSTS